ncbi:MAG: D-alanine--D-alanine ligase [Pseudomonadota bacterium]|nr:D-alanine--D-alanine ligase [Pseudomonadota bacterium]
MDTQFGKIAVLMGGHSAERDISLKSGQAVLAALQRQSIDAVGIDTAEAVNVPLTQTHFDRVFIALHGRGGEDGSIQGLLEHLGLPYTGTGILGSALAMDKYRTKLLWQGMGLPTPPCVRLHPQTDFTEVVAQLGLPLMVKPANEGSSVGMTKVTSLEALSQAWQTAYQFDPAVIAERYISGSEYTIAVLADQALPVIRLQTPREFYDFIAKYDDTHTLYHCPCGLAAAAEQQLQTLALQAFTALGASGWGRVDVMCDHHQQPWLLEVNTVPGMTDHSLVPMAAQAAGYSFDELVVRILATASRARD